VATRGSLAQSSGSVLVEVGNPERDLLVFDLGSGSLANFASLGLPVNALDKVFITHLHADYTADLITLFGSYRKSGRADRGVHVWGPSGSEPRFGTAHFVGRDPRSVQRGKASGLEIGQAGGKGAFLLRVHGSKVTGSSSTSTTSVPTSASHRTPAPDRYSDRPAARNASPWSR
jgi:Metal-dependent hydrolases of the beta-lactamase superfamily III